MTSTRDYVLLYVNGARHEIRGERAFQSLSDFLRYDLRLTGTKVVCAEGDCASCTVMLGKLSPVGALEYRTVASCIQFLFQLDCTHIVTIEGLKYDGELNPVQESFVREHGAQCGFCTPGFVVSVHSLLSEKPTCDEAALRRGLTGNLCRCTGYEPILRSALTTDCSKLRRIDELYPPVEMTREFARGELESVEIRTENHRLCKPTSINAAVRFRADNTNCSIVTGGTDFGVQINKGLRSPATVLSTSSIREFVEHRVEENVWIIGGGVTLSQLEREAATMLPQLSQMLDRFGSPQIRNAGTLAGNVANGSSIGDTLPLLFVLDAKVELVGPAGSRTVDINSFFTGYRQTVMKSEELIARIHLPLPNAGETLRLYKVSKRADLDISTFTAAIRLQTDGNAIATAQIAYGGVGPVVIRLRRTEEILRGAPFMYETFARAAESVASEISPISDVRGSADYRNLLAANILLKFAAEEGLAPDGGNGHVSPTKDGPPHIGALQEVAR